MGDMVFEDVRALYLRLIEAWNDQDAAAMAGLFADRGTQIGFDGSTAVGPDEIAEHLGAVFADHVTARYVVQVVEVRAVGEVTAVLRAASGLVPPGRSQVEPATIAHQTVVAARSGGAWRIELFQNTPAQFHGRPHLAEQMVAELNRLLD